MINYISAGLIMLYNGSYPWLYARFSEWLTGIRQKDPFGRIAVIVRSNSMRRSIKEYLALAKGIAGGLDFYTPVDLAALPEKSSRPLAPALQLETVRAVLRSEGLDFKGLARDFQKAAREIKENMSEAALLTDSLVHMRSFLDRYTALLANLETKTSQRMLDREDALTAAAGAFDQMPPLAGALAVFGLGVLTPLEREFLGALLEKIPQQAVFTPIFPSYPLFTKNEHFTTTWAFYKSYNKDAVTSEAPASGFTKYADTFFSRSVDHPPAGELNVRFINVPSAASECRAIARIIRNAVDSGKSAGFSGFCIVVQNMELYRGILSRTLDNYRIPYYLSETNRYLDRPAIKRLYSLLSLRHESYDRDILLGALDTERMKTLSVSSGGLFDKARLDISALEAHVSSKGIRSDIGSWRRYAQYCRSAPDSAKERELAVIRPYIEPLMQMLEDLESLPVEGPPDVMAQSRRAFINRTVGLDKDEAAALEGFLESLETSAVLRELYPVMTEQIFLESLFEALSAEDRSGRPAGDLVEIRKPGSAVGMLFDTLFFAGLSDSVFPPRLSESAAIPFDLRSAAGIPTMEDIYWQETAIFFYLASSARIVYLSCPRASDKGEETVPAAVYEETRRMLLGTAYYSLSSGDKNPADWQFEQRLLSEHTVKEPGNVETRSERIIRTALAGECRPAALDNILPGMARFDARLTAVNAEQLSPWDGLCGSFGSHNGFHLTPTSLEEYASCPYRFFIDKVLKAGAPRGPDLESMEANTRGDFIHMVLEAYYRQWPHPGQSAGKKAVEANLDEIYNACWDEKFALFDGHSIDFEKDILREKLTTFLVWDAARMKHLERSVALVETQPPVLSLEGFNFKGRLDRADRDSDGKLHIVDYKTGRNRISSTEKFKKDFLNCGKYLQVYLYPLMMGKKTRSSALIFPFAYSNRLFEIDTDDLTQDQSVRNEVKGLLNLLDKGYFTPNPLCNYCPSCPYLTACNKDAPTAMDLLSRIELDSTGRDYRMLTGFEHERPEETNGN